MLRHTVFSHKHCGSVNLLLRLAKLEEKLKTLQASSCLSRLSPLSVCKVFKVQTFPKKIRYLIKPLLNNFSTTTCQGTGPWEVPVHFSRFVPRVHNCSKRVQSWSWIQEKNLLSFSSSFFFFRFFLCLFIFLIFLFFFLFLVIFFFSFCDCTIFKWTFWDAKGNRINMLNPTH